VFLRNCQTATIKRSTALLFLVVAVVGCSSRGSGDQAVISPTTAQLETTTQYPVTHQGGWGATWSIGGLQEGTTYYARSYLRDIWGEETWSAPMTFTTLVAG